MSKYYVAIEAWEGLEDIHEDWYSGTLHENRADAHAELLDARTRDIEGNTYIIKEVLA